MPNSDQKLNSQIEDELEEEAEYKVIEVEKEIEVEEEEEVEYKEVEVEEEIQEEEEIEEEEEEIEEEEEEEAEDEEKTNDTSKGLEFDEYGKGLDLIKSTPEESESILASTGKKVTDLTNNKEAPYTSVPNVPDKHISLIESGCSETSNHEKEIVENQTPDENVQQVQGLSPQEVNNEGLEEKIMMEVDFTLEKEGRILAALNVSSMLTPQKRPRSSTPVNELENSSKKTAIICDFFARGWCIKGNSCRFLHQKERNEESITEPSRKENVLDGSGSHGESKSMSLSSQEKPYSSIPLLQTQDNEHISTLDQIPKRELYNALPSQEKPYSPKPLLQTQDNEHISTHDQIPKRELYNASPLSRRYSYSPPVRNSAVNDRCHFNDTLMSPSNYLNNNRYSLDPMNLRDNGFDKGYQSSGSSSLPKNSSSFLSKFTNIPSNFPAHFRRKIESEENSWETSMPFVPTYPSIIARLYPHKKQYDSRNVLTNRNVLNSSTKNDSRTAEVNAFAHESYGQSSGAKPLLPKEEKYVSTNNSIDVASANNDNGVASANIVGGVALGQGSNLKHGGGDMEVESKESKEMKAFRVALIEFVKELVKPFWHAGRLTKDTHKKVVKKSIEKVICSFEAYQIPSESESINQYLSANQPKLLKLVEAYVAKYSIA